MGQVPKSHVRIRRAPFAQILTTSLSKLSEAQLSVETEASMQIRVASLIKRSFVEVVRVETEVESYCRTAIADIVLTFESGRKLVLELKYLRPSALYQPHRHPSQKRIEFPVRWWRKFGSEKTEYHVIDTGWRQQLHLERCLKCRMAGAGRIGPQRQIWTPATFACSALDQAMDYHRLVRDLGENGGNGVDCWSGVVIAVDTAFVTSSCEGQRRPISEIKMIDEKLNEINMNDADSDDELIIHRRRRLSSVTVKAA